MNGYLALALSINKGFFWPGGGTSWPGGPPGLYNCRGNIVCYGYLGLMCVVESKSLITIWIIQME